MHLLAFKSKVGTREFKCVSNDKWSRFFIGRCCRAKARVTVLYIEFFNTEL
jgi:hypothetical protein